MIKELQNEYDKAKRVIRRREDKRLAVIKEQDGEDNVENIDEEHSAIPTNRQDGTEQSENRSTDDICIVDDDYSISSTDYLPRLNSDDSSVTSSISPHSGARCSSRSLFVSALSQLPSHYEENFMK
jgi:hypothetical protein